MDKKSQIEHFDRFVEKQREVMLNKGDDYANSDRLSNFKTAGHICGLSPQQHCLAMIATKVARLGVLLDPNTGIPKHESVQDSILDLANYAVLLDMIESDLSVQAVQSCCGEWNEDGSCKCKNQ